MSKLINAILWEPLKGGNGVTQMNEFAEYFLVVTYPFFILIRSLILHIWEVDLYPIGLAQAHLAAIVGIAGVVAYKTVKNDKPTNKDSKANN